MLLSPIMALWKRMIGFILLPEFLFFSSIFHQSLESPLYKGCFEVEEDFFSSTHLPPFICEFGLLPETLHHRTSIKTGTTCDVSPLVIQWKIQSELTPRAMFH